MSDKIFNPKSGNYVSVDWAMTLGSIINEDGDYVNEEGDPTSIFDIVDHDDVDLSYDELIAKQEETKKIVSGDLDEDGNFTTNDGQDENNSKSLPSNYEFTDKGGIKVD